MEYQQFALQQSAVFPAHTFFTNATMSHDHCPPQTVPVFNSVPLSHAQPFYQSFQEQPQHYAAPEQPKQPW